MGVLIVGSLNIDIVTYLERMPEPGETVVGNRFESFPGGKGLNQAVAPDLSSTIGIWRNLWTDNKSMAKSAREYIENKIVIAKKTNRLFSFICLKS